MITANDLVTREIHYCASQLIAKLSETTTKLDGFDMHESWHDELYQLTAPLPDPEEVAVQHGWWRQENTMRKMIARKDFDGTHFAETWEDACDQDGLDPYECIREIYEHWIVSDWLADKLARHGETVSKDFMGLTIWARTTTGQAIAADEVIQRIANDLNKARNGVPLMPQEATAGHEGHKS